MSTLAVVERVIRETQTPMSVRDIVEIAGDALPTRSKTPDTVVARDLSMNIKKLGEASKFIRTAPGRYTMREFVSSGIISMGDTGDRERIEAIRLAMDKAREAATPVLGNALSEERRDMLSGSKSSSSFGRAQSEQGL